MKSGYTSVLIENRHGWTYDDGGYSFGVVALTPSRGRQPVTWAIAGMRMRRSASVLPLTLLCLWSHCLGSRRPSSDRQDLNPHLWQIVCCLGCPYDAGAGRCVAICIASRTSLCSPQHIGYDSLRSREGPAHFELVADNSRRASGLVS